MLVLWRLKPHYDNLETLHQLENKTQLTLEFRACFGEKKQFEGRLKQAKTESFAREQAKSQKKSQN